MTYVELQAASHFSFLRGVSSCEELFATAALLGYPALGITDRNSVAGLVRATIAAETTGVRLIAGAHLELVDGTALLVWPEDLAAWSRLTRLLTLGRCRADPTYADEKGRCFLDWADLSSHSAGLVAALVPDDLQAAEAALGRFSDIFGERGHLALTQRRRPRDSTRLQQLNAFGPRFGLRPVTTGDVLYDSPEKRILQDVVTAIREHCTIDELGFRRERYPDRHLKSPREMERRFRDYPDAVRATADIAERCTFSLRELRYQYPDEIGASGRSPQQALEEMSWTALRAKFPEGVPEAYSKLLGYELEQVGKLGYAPYFLTVNSIVAFARSQGILCQGRGSAANSVICYVLGITSIDPVRHELLFERFISEERNEPPDIDVDFEHQRREEVVQWIYETYGRRHAAITAVISRYRAKGAVRDVGKALGLPEDVTGALAGQVWGWSEEGVQERHVEELNLDSSEPRLALTLRLARQLIGTPRHFSQHPGGFVLTRDPLDDLVPIQPATPNTSHGRKVPAPRHIIEWEKDDIEELGFMKVDVLGLGMLSCLRRAFDLLREQKGIDMEMANLTEEDPEVYAMIQPADTLGVFQIESRAQMSMLPRMKPATFYDLVIEVAIVRPGPIQGDMVHPYLRRREGKEKPEYPKPELKAVLEKTLGVPLFQEQAMKVAIVGAGFTPAEADALRRSMATFKFSGGVSRFHDKLVEGMVARGYERDFADRTFRQIEGFGSYGFPESHAASFAKIVYASCWVKCHHPDVFCVSLLNSLPMGFYAPAQIVYDARKHDVAVRPVCINASRWDCTLEEPAGRHRAIRLGLRMVHGLSAKDVALIVGARLERPFASVEDVWLRSGAPVAALEKIAEADGFASLGFDRREALWRVRALGEKPLPLFAAADAREEGREPSVELLPMSEGREVVDDYHSVQLSLRAHPLKFLRSELERVGAVRAADLRYVKDGTKVVVAGLVLVRQRPGSTNVTFVTIEDETGFANIIIWQQRYEAQRRIVLSAAMMGVRGTLQREGDVIHVIADRLIDHSALLRSIGERQFPHRHSPADGASAGGGPDPRDKWQRRVRSDYTVPFRIGETAIPELNVKSRNFH
ncbi:MAG TPA: error-prone DNA polymerase [Allosphingosinicella sp.]|nr:error-prone DNA polymerase [Allosphingosinicella sp.]